MPPDPSGIRVNGERQGAEALAITLAGASADAEYGLLTLAAWRYNDEGAEVAAPRDEMLSFALPENSEATIRVAESNGGLLVLGLRPAAGSAGDATLSVYPRAGQTLTIFARLGLGRTPTPDDVIAPAARALSLSAVTGYFGPAFPPQVNAGYGLENPEIVPPEAGAVDTESAMVFVSAANPVGAVPLGLTLAADAVCLTRDICAPLRVAVTATIYPVSSPTQPILSAPYEDLFAHPVSLPDGFENGATLSVSGVSGGSGGAEATLFAVDENNQIIPGSDPATIAAGSYEITLAMTRGDLLGTLALLVSAEISAAELAAADYGLPGLTPGEAITVAADYAGSVYAVALGEDATDAIIELPSEVGAGFALSLSSDSRTATLLLEPALSGGAGLSDSFTLAVVRQKNGAADGNYAPLTQTLFATVSALSEVALAAVSDVIPYNGAYAENANIHNFRTELGGAYTEATFGKESGAGQLDVSAEGVVFSNADIAAPDTYTIVATATASAYLGTARMTFELELTAEAVRTVRPDEVVAAEFRAVTIDAAVGFSGPAYAVPVSVGYALRNPTFAPAGGGLFDADNTVIAIPVANPIGGAGLNLEMTADAVCLVNTPCLPLQIAVSVVFNAVADPGQVSESAVYLDGFAVDLNLPSGYENGGAKSTGRTLTLFGVNGVAADALGNVSLAVDSANARLEYAPNREAANALTVGGYTATIAMTQAELLGTVYLAAAFEITPRPLSADEYGLSAAPDVVTVAAGDGAVGEEVAAVSLTAAAAGAEVVLPDVFPGGVSMSLLSDARGAAFYLTTALAGGAEIDETTALTVSLTDNANYAPLERAARIRVSALAQPVALETAGRIVDGAPFASADAANLKTGDYANAIFARVDDESSGELLIGADSGVVSTNGDITATGRYSLVALATSPDYIGTARLEVILNVLAQNTLDPTNGIPESARVRTRLAVAGHAGSVAFFAAGREGVTLRTPTAAPSGFGFGADGLGAEFVSPAGVTLFLDAGEIPNEGDAASAVFELTAKLAGFEDATIPITVTVTAVSRPTQPTLRAAYAEEFSHSPALPSGLETGSVLSLAGVSAAVGEGASLFAVANNRIERGAQAADVGRYEISLALSHSDLLGTLTLVVPAEIEAAELAAADYGLPGLTPAEGITVAADYAGSVYAVALPESASVAIIELPSEVGAGFALSLSSDSRTATLLLDPALSGGAGLSDSFTLAVVRQSEGAADGNYAPLTQTLFATVSALSEVALAGVSGLIPYNGAYAQNASIYDFRTELGGAYTEATFGKESGAAQLDVSAEGVVSSNADIAIPDIYTIVATATASAYLGTARMTFELELTAEAVRTVRPDEVVAAGARLATIDAAVGFSGPAYAVPVSVGYALQNPTFAPADGGLFDADNTVIAIPVANPIGGAGLNLEMTADAVCLVNTPCLPLQIAVSVVFDAVADPGQDLESTAYLDGFVVDLNLPSGYENGGAKSTGRTLTLFGVNGVAADALGNVSLAVDSANARLAYAPNREAANALTVGGYTATVAMTQTELLGTVFMRVAIEVSPRPLSADDYGLSAAPDVVTVAAGDGAAGAAVATIALTTSATDAQVVLPEAFPSGLSISRTADTFGAVFYLASGLASESVLNEVGTLTVSLTDNANYAPLERTARIRVSALAQFVALETSGRIADGAVFSSDNVANLKTGDYANAVFARVDDESDSALRIDADSGVVSTDGDVTAAGRYSLVALATSPDYVGAARLEVILNVLAQNTLGPADSIPESGRVRTRLAVAGYAGSVAFFAAERSGVILKTPASAPSGFGFGADGAGAEFVSPEGFTLFMDAGEIADEGDAATAAFTLTAKLTGFEDADVPVTVTVTAVSRPVQPVLRAAHADPFSHSPALPDGLETGAVLSVAGVSVSGEGDGAGLFAIANGRVEQGAQAPEVGSYEISLALTHSDLLGTLTLVVSAEISAAELREADYGLAGLTPGEPIAVAANYVGSVYAVALPESATDAIIQLPSDVASDEFELALSGDSRGAELRLTSAAAGADVSGAFALTVVRQSGGAADGNYLPLSQTLHATVSALPEVDLAATSGFVPYAANNNIYDLRAASGAAHASASFGKGGGAAQLDVSAAGVVFSNAGIGAAGIYTLIATATSDAYLGSARMTFELTLSAPQAAVAFSAIPADGSGGTLTADGLTSGDFVERGSEVVFAARPAAEWHVASWSAGECGADSVGDPLSPGVEKTCALRANAALDVTVFFARAGEITEAEGVAAARRDATIYVAPSYQGEVHRAFAESAEVVVASDSVSHGRTDLFAASIGGGTLTIVLRAPLAADFAADVFTITLEGVGAGARVPRAELVSVRVERLALPIAGRVEFDGDDGRTKSEAIVYDFSAANPDYDGAAFELVSAPAELTMETDGKVLVADKESLQEGGSYNVRAVARGAAANPFLGSAEFELEVNVRISEGAALSALPLARRTAEVFAVSGYQGSVYALTLESGSPFEAAYLPPPSGFDLDEATGEVSVPALSGSGLGGLFTVRISRGGSAFRNAAVSLAVFAVAPRQQRDLVATLAADGTPSGFPHAIALPSGFAAADYQISIVGVDGGANHFATANNALTTGTEPLTIGAYAITLGIWHSGFLGTITAIINARVGGFGDIADADEIPEAARTAEVLVAPSYAGEVYRAAAANADVELLLPDAVDSGFALARGADNEAVFSLLAPLSSEGEAVVTATITQRSGEVFEDATVAVSVSALAVPDELQVGIEERSAAIKVAAETGVITLSLGGLNAADLAFSLHADDGGYFETPPAGGSAGEVGVTLAPPIGSYGITVAAWSAESPPAFLGTVYHAAVLIVRADDAPALEVATAFPQNGTTLTSRAAVGYVGALLTLTSPLADVVLRFPQAGRAAFDSREDFAYDYDANVLSLKRALENGGRADATITLTAERAGGAAELTVSVFAEALAVDSVSAGINAVAGYTGGLYNFASGDLAEASFRQVSVSSEALTILADGSVVATSALGEVGERYTLVGAATAGPDPLLFFQGEVEVSLEVEVAAYPQKRGLYYQEYNEGECSDLGGNWRLPALFEAGGLMVGLVPGQPNFDSIGFAFLFGDTDIIPGLVSGFQPLNRNDPAIVEHGVWLETGATGREDENSPPARVGAGRDSNRILVDVLPRDDGEQVTRYCVAPVDPATYDPVPDPAEPCFANAEGTGCGEAPIFYGLSQGDVAEVEILAARGAELARVSDASFNLSVSASDSGADVPASHGAISSSSGILTVAMTLRRNVRGPATATLRAFPESGRPRDLEVSFAPGDVRRGLHFRHAPEGSCSALGSGWRLPNLAEASGLLWRNGTEGANVTLRTNVEVLEAAGPAMATVLINTRNRVLVDGNLELPPSARTSILVDIPGLLGAALTLSLRATVSGDTSALSFDAIRTDLIGLDSSGAAVNVAAVRTETGSSAGIAGEAGVSSAQMFCVRPDDSASYVQPADPAGVCLLPDCAEVGALNGAANARTTVTLLAWRYGPAGQTVSAGDGYGLSLQALGNVGVNALGAFSGGRLTAELVAPASGVAIGETAAFELSPEFGAAATLRFGPVFTAFGDAELIGGESAYVSAAEVLPTRVAVEYLGSRRGLTYVRTSESLSDANAFALCEAGGGGWRVPSIGELAGLFADGSQGQLADSGVGENVYASGILPGARSGARIEFAAAQSEDGAALSDGGVSHYADAVQEDGRTQAFRVLTDGGAVRISLSWPGSGGGAFPRLEGAGDRRGVCVLAADGYVRPAQLSEAAALAGAEFSAAFDRQSTGAGVFHRIEVAAQRNRRNQFGVVRENQALSLSLAVGGDAANLFAAEISGPDDNEVSEVALSQAAPLAVGVYDFAVSLWPAYGAVTTALAVTVSVAPWLSPVGTLFAAEGYFGEIARLSERADVYGLTLRGTIPAESGLEVLPGEDSEIVLGVPTASPLARFESREAELAVEESASGTTGAAGLSVLVSVVSAPLAEEQDLHVAAPGEQFAAETRYLVTGAYLTEDYAVRFSPGDAGAVALIGGVDGGSAGLFGFDADYHLRLASPESAPSGRYRVTIQFAHPGFVGTVTVVVPAEVLAEDPAALPFDADVFVPVRAREFYAAAGYSGTALEVSLTIAGARFSDVEFVQGGDGFTYAVGEGRLRLNVPAGNEIAAGEVRYAEVRASVHSPAYESGRIDLTAQLRGLTSEGVEGSLSIEENLSAWTYSGFADLLPDGDYSASLTLGVELFTLSREGTLSLRPDVNRETLEALLDGAETAATLAEIVAEGAAFLGAHGARAVIRIYGEGRNPINPADFSPAFARAATIIVAPDFARDAVNTGTESFSLTVVYPPGPDWRLDVVAPSPSWDTTGTVRESDGAAGYRIGFRSFGSGEPRGGETLTREIVFAGFYPEGYTDPDNGLRSRDGALTLRLAVSAVAEIPTGRVEFAATTRVSSRVDAASGGTIVYAGWLDSLAEYSEVSLQFAPPDGVSNDGDVLRLFDLDSQGRLVWTPTLFAEDDDFARHLDSRVLERYGFQTFLAAVDVYSASYLGALRLTAQIVFRASELAGRPKLPTGIPETGEIAGGL